jgi:hypothetical protein
LVQEGDPTVNRRDHLTSFYDLLNMLEGKVGGSRKLGDSHGRLPWPPRGVYFFFEPGETRFDSGNGPRVVRVGTHALTSGSRSGLWKRLSQHRGIRSGGGNHRGSIFRLLVGTALKKRGIPDSLATWGNRSKTSKIALERGINRDLIIEAESALEKAVSEYIRSMPFLWLDVGDIPGPDSVRGSIERNSIALLSNYDKTTLDPASEGWLGRDCDRSRVTQSGLWNNNHVDEPYDPGFLAMLENHIEGMAAFQA